MVSPFVMDRGYTGPWGFMGIERIEFIIGRCWRSGSEITTRDVRDVLALVCVYVKHPGECIAFSVCIGEYLTHILLHSERGLHIELFYYWYQRILGN